jgi:hypothetical protein
MPRERLRVCLQDGLKLDLNQLIRRGFVRPGECTGPLLIQWLNSDGGEARASGLITANLCGQEEGWLHFKSSSLDQWGSGRFQNKCEILQGTNPRLRELVALAVLAAFGCGLALSQGDLLFVAIFGAACAVTIIEARRVYRER